MDLAPPLEDIDPLLGGGDGIAVEIGGALLELREVLDALEGSLRSKEALDVDPAEAGGLDAMPELLRADVAHEVGGAVRVPVGVAVEAGDAAARTLRAAVFRLVELRLREGREQEAEALELLGVQGTAHDLVVVVDGEELPARHVPEVGARGQVDGRRELGQEVLRKVEVQVEPRQVAALLPLDLVEVELREEHPALGMVRVGQRLEALRKDALVP